MGFIRNKAASTLNSALADKADGLRSEQALQSQNAANYQAAAADALTQSKEAARQATAVEKALDVLTSAGVEL